MSAFLADVTTPPPSRRKWDRRASGSGLAEPGVQARVELALLAVVLHITAVQVGDPGKPKGIDAAARSQAGG